MKSLVSANLLICNDMLDLCQQDGDITSSLTNGEFIIEPCLPSDLSRSLTILERYADANLGLVDASIMAIAERLGITKILTCDRRHFSLFRPKHCTGFELCP